MMMGVGELKWMVDGNCNAMFIVSEALVGWLRFWPQEMLLRMFKSTIVH